MLHQLAEGEGSDDVVLVLPEYFFAAADVVYVNDAVQLGIFCHDGRLAVGRESRVVFLHEALELVLVVAGRGVAGERLVVDVVHGSDPQPVNLIPRYTHQITNVGKCNSHTIMWISEVYNPDTADTYKEEVE